MAKKKEKAKLPERSPEVVKEVIEATKEYVVTLSKVNGKPVGETVFLTDAEARGLMHRLRLKKPQPDRE